MCGSGVEDTSIDIIGAAGSNINIDIECPKCEKHSMVKAEVAQIDLNMMNINAESIEKLKERLSGLRQWLEVILKNKRLSHTPASSKNTKETLIKDEEIIDLSKDLKPTHCSVEDLLGDK